MLDERDDIAVYDASEEENEREAQRHQMRKERAQKMQMEKQRSMKRQRYILLGSGLAVILVLLIMMVAKHINKKDPKDISAADRNSDGYSSTGNRNTGIVEL